MLASRSKFSDLSHFIHQNLLLPVLSSKKVSVLQVAISDDVRLCCSYWRPYFARYLSRGDVMIFLKNSLLYGLKLCSISGISPTNTELSKLYKSVSSIFFWKVISPKYPRAILCTNNDFPFPCFPPPTRTIIPSLPKGCVLEVFFDIAITCRKNFLT